MAMVDCPECEHQVSETAASCPSCGHILRVPTRGAFGKLCKWVFILFNVLMLFWMIHVMGIVGDMPEATSGMVRVGLALGAGAAKVYLLMLWFFGDIILGLFVLFTRPKLK